MKLKCNKCDNEEPTPRCCNSSMILKQDRRIFSKEQFWHCEKCKRKLSLKTFLKIKPNCCKEPMKLVE